MDFKIVPLKYFFLSSEKLPDFKDMVNFFLYQMELEVTPLVIMVNLSTFPIREVTLFYSCNISHMLNAYFRSFVKKKQEQHEWNLTLYMEGVQVEYL